LLNQESIGAPFKRYKHKFDLAHDELLAVLREAGRGKLTRQAYLKFNQSNQSSKKCLIEFNPIASFTESSVPARVEAKAMNPLATLVILGWIPLVLYLFNRFPAQRAVVVSYVTGFLFLPEVISYPIAQGIPVYNKASATTYCILLATVLYDSKRFSSFKPGLLDVPMLIWCLCPIATQLSNGLSPISPTLNQIVAWGLPYFFGRIYLNDLAGLRQLAVGIFTGGMIYVPLCLLEMRIAPTLHLRLYGVHARADFAQTVRYGGYRPTVFLVHGLWVGLWMMAATLIGIWLWRTKVIKQLRGIPIRRLVVVLIITFILVKSTGAYIYLAIGTVILFTAGWLRSKIPVLLLIAALSTYLYLGATGALYSMPQVVSFLSDTQSSQNDRTGSLAFRIINEEALSQKARQRMILGWGDSGGSRIYDEEGNDISVTDSLWIIAYGLQGLVGLISFTASLFAAPLGLCFSRYSPSTWSNPKVAPAAALALVLILYMLDSALNAMACPVFMVASGGISGLVMQEPQTSKAISDRSSIPQRSSVQRRQNLQS
jgi:hypothetical protein